MRYKASDILTMRNQARAAHCTANDLFWFANPLDLVEVCNGFGSEDAAKWERDALTLVFRKYAVVAAIHDCRYEESDGSEAKRRIADREFRDNAIKVWKLNYGFWRFFRPAAYADLAKLRLAYVTLREFGGGAWREAYQRKLAEEKAE